jgi:hypothetical protein
MREILIIKASVAAKVLLNQRTLSFRMHTRLPAFAQGAKAFDAAHAGSAPACRKNC